MKSIEAMYDMDINELEDVMITAKQINELAMDYALGEIFSNVNEDGWPDNPLEFLGRTVREEGFTSHDEMIPVVDYEYDDAEVLADRLYDLQKSFARAINEALVIERG